jgi:NADH dehydrogenase
MTMAELNRWVAGAIGRNRPVVEIPDPVARAMVRVTGWLPGAPITWDQWLMMGRDNVASGPGFEAFHLCPAPLAAVAEIWLTAYRRRGRFAKAAAG